MEYGDYECPYCAAARPVLAALVDEGRIQLVFRNFPLADVHPYALTAVLAAEAAAAAGRFWAMHDLLFTHQRQLRDVDLARHAAELGLPPASVVGDAAQPYGDKVEADFASGADSGVRPRRRCSSTVASTPVRSRSPRSGPRSAPPATPASVPAPLAPCWPLLAGCG